MEELEKFLTKQDVTGDLKKILLNEKLELPEGREAPEGFETMDDYKAKLWLDHEEKRKKVVVDKYVQPLAEELAKKKLEDSYVATVNPLRNLLVTLGGYDKKDIGEMDIKELIKKYDADKVAKLKAARENKNTNLEAVIKESEEKDDLIIQLKQQMENTILEKNKEIEDARADERKASRSDIMNREMLSLAASVLPELTIGNVNSALALINSSMTRHGYKWDLQLDDNGINRLLPKSSTGTDAMDLGKNKHVTKKELVLELALADGYFKRSNSQPDPNPSNIKNKNIKKNKDGKEFEIVLPKFLQQA